MTFESRENKKKSPTSTRENGSIVMECLFASCSRSLGRAQSMQTINLTFGVSLMWSKMLFTRFILSTTMHSG